MRSDKSDHPSISTLEAGVLGALSKSEAKALAAHLKKCRDCHVRSEQVQLKLHNEDVLLRQTQASMASSVEGKRRLLVRLKRSIQEKHSLPESQEL